MKRKLISICLAACVCFSFVGCGSSNTKTTDSEVLETEDFSEAEDEDASDSTTSEESTDGEVEEEKESEAAYEVDNDSPTDYLYGYENNSSGDDGYDDYVYSSSSSNEEGNAAYEVDTEEEEIELIDLIVSETTDISYYDLYDSDETWKYDTYAYDTDYCYTIVSVIVTNNSDLELDVSGCFYADVHYYDAYDDEVIEEGVEIYKGIFNVVNGSSVITVESFVYDIIFTHLEPGESREVQFLVNARSWKSSVVNDTDIEYDDIISADFYLVPESASLSDTESSYVINVTEESSNTYIFGDNEITVVIEGFNDDGKITGTITNNTGHYIKDVTYTVYCLTEDGIPYGCAVSTSFVISEESAEIDGMKPGSTAEFEMESTWGTFELVCTEYYSSEYMKIEYTVDAEKESNS